MRGGQGDGSSKTLFVVIVFFFSLSAVADWQWANTKPQGNDLSGVVWGGEGFVAVGDAGTIMTSPDGINWSERSSGRAEAVTWGSDRFVMVGLAVAFFSVSIV